MPKPNLYRVTITVFDTSQTLGFVYAHSPDDAYTDGVPRFGLPSGAEDAVAHAKMLGFSNAESDEDAQYGVDEVTDEMELVNHLQELMVNAKPSKLRYIAVAMR